MATTVAHLGGISRAVDDDVFLSHADGEGGAVTQEGVGEGRDDVHVGGGVAEFEFFRAGHFDGSLADNGALMATAARRLQVAEDFLKKFSLEEFVGLGGELEASLVFLQSLGFGHLPDEFLNLLLDAVEFLHLFGRGELAHFLQIDDGELRCFLSLLDLFEETVDGLEFLFDFERFVDAQGFVAGELIFAGEFVDLVFVGKIVDQLDELLSEAGAFVTETIPESFEFTDLFLLHRLAEVFLLLGGRSHAAGAALVLVSRLFGDFLSLVGFEDFSLSFFEHPPKGFETGAESGDLGDVETDGTDEFFLGEFPHVPIFEEVLEGGRDEIGGRGCGTGKRDGIVFLIGVNDSAELLTRTHR